MAYGNLYRPDRLFLPQQALRKLSQALPTPFYLYHEAGIRKAAQLVKGSFCWNPAHKPYFPIKANAAPMVLRILHEEGFGVLAQSEQELLLASHLGFSGDEILFHTAAMTQSVTALLKTLGAGVIFDAPEQIERMKDALPNQCLLRYHPGKGKNAALFTGNTDRNKSGMAWEQIFVSAQRLADLGAKNIGLHCHLASRARKEGYYPAVAQELFSLANALQKETGICAFCCDLGGGIDAVPLSPLSRIGALVREQYRTCFSMAPTIYTELGRFVSERHGILVSRVVEVRERSRHYVVLDASVAKLPAVLLHRSEPHISVVGNCARDKRLVYSVHGCTPDALDRFCDRAVLPQVQPGDLVALRMAGAYAESMQMQLCMLPPCRSYVYTLNGTIEATDF